MGKDTKRLLIADDTEIDRIALKSIVGRNFDVLEASSGHAACECIAAQGDNLDGVLLDISMPDMDGFAVLDFMEEQHLDQIPVFLITAEPTMDNVQRAIRHHIAEFIGKPFHREEVLQRLRKWMYITLEPDLPAEALDSTWAYISDLEGVYQAYLANHGRSDVPSRLRSDLMRILLESYNKNHRDHRLNRAGIELACKAACFCDLGELLLPWGQPMSPGYQELWRNHPLLGASLVRLNRDPRCAYFVEQCADMCLHHHERYDGQGFPDRLSGTALSIYSQLCRLADEFELARGGAYEGSQTISLVISRLTGDEGLVNPALFKLLTNCESKISNYFQKLYQGA